MSEGAILSTEEDTRLLAEVLLALDQRRDLPGGAARENLDTRLVLALRRLGSPPTGSTRAVSQAPPRAIAVAMALTVFSQPHLVATFGKPPEEGEPPQATPVLLGIDALSDILGLPRWELEELRSEVDRRVFLHLKQYRAIGWLWAQFGLPQSGVGALVEVLLPGLREDAVSRVGLSRRGAQLYALVDQPRAPSSAAIYLGWLDRSLEGAVAPRGTFSGRYVDRTLRQRITRGIGGEDEEVVSLLDRAVTVVPRSEAPAFLAMDRWRSLAFDCLTGLAGPYTRAAHLHEPLDVDAVNLDGWARRSGDRIVFEQGKALFDSMALERASEVARQLHAHTLATVLALGDRAASGVAMDELIRYDVRRHLRCALDPLLGWAGSEATAARAASRMGGNRVGAAESLQALAVVWRSHLENSWIGSLDRTRAPSVSARLAAQLIRTRHTLGELVNRRPALDQEHREAALLFAGHYFAEAPLERLWTRDADELGEDPVGRWFWPTWLRLLEAREQDSTTEFTLQF